MKRPRTTRQLGARSFATAAAAVIVMALTACATSADYAAQDETAPGNAARSTDSGTIIDVTTLGVMSVDEAAAYLRAAEHDDGAVTFAVTSYKVTYRTVDAAGEPTRASGLLVLPEDNDAPLHAVVYGHGTTNDRTDVASAYADDFTVSPGIAFASRGLATLLPDYVGLGNSPGAHPYLHLPTETSAATDMLTAVGDHLATEGRELAPEVFVSGFSPRRGPGAPAVLRRRVW